MIKRKILTGLEAQRNANIVQEILDKMVDEDKISSSKDYEYHKIRLCEEYNILTESVNN